MKQTTIYGLRNSVTKQVVYIGKTDRPLNIRFSEHKSQVAIDAPRVGKKFLTPEMKLDMHTLEIWGIQTVPAEQTERAQLIVNHYIRKYDTIKTGLNTRKNRV